MPADGTVPALMQPLRGRMSRRTAWILGATVSAATAAAVVLGVDGTALRRAGRAAVTDPVGLMGVLALYAGAFALRGWAWARILPRLDVRHAIAAVHVALAGNHVLPLRLGEPLRVVSAVRRAGVDPAAATASTVVLRAGDVAALSGLVLVTGGAAVAGGATVVWLVLALALVVVGGGLAWARRMAAERRVRRPGPAVIGATVAAWVLEAGIVWQAAAWAGVGLGVREAVLVTSVTVAAQIVAVAPGGFGTYEAAGTAALAALGVDPATGLAVAVTAHAVKTGYALAGGGIAAVVPAPSLLGRLRVPTATPRASAPGADGAPDDGHVVLFLPAHDEAGRVGAVVERVPDVACGRPVRCVVIDDGSADGTAAEAAAAGAEVVSMPDNVGLGAAVRRGLAEAVAGGAAAVAFCDADGEYAPEELSRLLAPILEGDADYVVGSRFAGAIERMLPHRRFGNRVLTRILRLVTRAPITDGQSGYRALSRAAAAQAEIVHDFNYAQVLTIDLLCRGFRYAEVPISYRFRTGGRSFVRLGPYLRAVVPAVWRALNRREPAAEPG